jgi:hypothetical protein
VATGELEQHHHDHIDDDDIDDHRDHIDDDDNNHHHDDDDHHDHDIDDHHHDDHDAPRAPLTLDPAETTGGQAGEAGAPLIWRRPRPRTRLEAWRACPGS